MACLFTPVRSAGAGQVDHDHDHDLRDLRDGLVWCCGSMWVDGGGMV